MKMKFTHGRLVNLGYQMYDLHLFLGPKKVYHVTLNHSEAIHLISTNQNITINANHYPSTQLIH